MTPVKRPSLDPTTGFLDRKAGRQAALALAAAADDGPAGPIGLAVIWLDIDRFRQVNESFGHRGGDAVIARLAGRIRAVVDLPSELARMGSDEFAVLIPGLGRVDAAHLAGKLLREIEKPLAIDGILIHPSASIGVATHRSGDDPLAVLELADRAMLEAKRQGGNRLVLSGDEPVAGRLGVQLAREELAIESALHTALESGGLRLDFQPIIGCDGGVEAVEALMRCHANGRRIAPTRFIPVAEKTGLIVRLGEWSLLQGARCAARLRELGAPTKLAINVSRAQLTSPSFIQALHGALICADVPPQLVELELTESLAMDLSQTVQANLRNARAVGVGLAIDDFGTGYSSLANLKDLPATKLKLDQSFVSVLPADRRALAVVKAMAQLGRELGMTIVAEGVETGEQLRALAEAGVDACQGFYFARPMAEDALLTWMKQRARQ